MIKKFTKIEIFWIDSVHDSGWQQLSNFKASEEQMDHRTVGYVVHESNISLSVAQSFGENRNDTTIDSVMMIPKVSIIKIKKFK